MNASSLLMLFAFGGASFGAASTGAIFRPGEWYRRLDKPRWRPPDWLFAPAWTVLYAMIAWSGWLVWRQKGLADASVPLTAYAGPTRPERRLDADLLRAAAASPGGDRDRDSLGVHRGNDLLLSSRQPRRGRYARSVPVWVSFAAALNISIWRRNPPARVAKGAR
jgi:tryptophan-rich sensory protein